MEKKNTQTISLIDRSTEALKSLGVDATTAYTLINTGRNHIEIGDEAINRFQQIAECTNADMLFADYYENSEGVAKKHPLIDCQFGSLRDDFDFGPILFFKTSSLIRAIGSIQKGYKYAALYDLRLRMKKIVHINEFLYTEEKSSIIEGGEAQFNYVDLKNRAAQIEMEEVCTEYLKCIDAYLHRTNKTVDFEKEAPREEFPIEASVIIPVYNRVNTVKDAILSALNQTCDFPFNVIVVDNHSTDGTSELIAEIAKSERRLVHLVPDTKDKGIGGCWNYALNHRSCGRFAIQLDSDDIYSGEDTIKKIVDGFYGQNAAMLIGTYQLTDFDLNPIPPGIIDHREWTDNNGRNNALRINGLGAPRAFFTPIAREIGFPNTCYGEDYAMGIRIARDYKIARIYDVLYHCRRWSGNSDSALSIEATNKNNLYKDRLRTWELEARVKMNKEEERRRKE